MKKELLRKLLRETAESTTLDFKREIRLDRPEEKKEFAKDVSAFANTDGGYIVFGKEDSKEGGRIVGVDPKTFDSEKMQQIVSARCNPSVKFEAELIRLGKKWFALLTIPESSMKPHESAETKDVFLRRGETTTKASTRERIRLWQESERRLKPGEPESEDAKSATLEDTVVGLSLFSMMLMCYIPIRLVTFWLLGKGLSLLNWVSPEAVFTTIIVAAIIMFVSKALFGESFNETIIRSVRKAWLPYLVLLCVVILATLILNLTILLYPELTRLYFQGVWQDFLLVCCLSLAAAFVLSVFSYFPTAQYFGKLKDPEYKPNPKTEAKQLISDLKQNAKYLQKKSVVFVLIGLLAATVAVVPVDLAVGIFVPSFREEGEFFSHSYYVSDRIYLFIYAERVSPSTISLDCRFYRLAQRMYTIYPGKLPILSLIRIPNRTNVTEGSTEDPGIGSSSSVTSKRSLGYVSLNASANVNYTFIPKSYNFTHIELGFSGISEPFVLNTTYWKFLQNPNITVTVADPKYNDLGNGTWLEIYTFMITNNEEVPLTTMAFQFDRFLYSPVNATTTKVYTQGQEWITDFVHPNRRISIYSTISRPHTLNLTITFHSSDIT